MRARRNRTRTLGRAGLIAAAVGMGLLALLPGAATAGEFSVTQCGGAGSWFDGQYSRLGGVDRVNVLSGCRSVSQDRVGIYQDRRGGSFSVSEGGQYLWRAPAGISVTGISLRAKLKDANGLRASVSGRAGGTEIDLDGGLAHDGSVVEARWSNRLRPLDSLAVRLRCNRQAGCPNRADSVKGFFEVLAVELQVADEAPPALDRSGELFGTAAAGSWLGGAVGYSLNASDIGSGLSEVVLRVNGFPVNLPAPACTGASGGRAFGFSPCPSTASRSAQLDTRSAPFQEGANTIEACASDFAGSGRRANTTCAPATTVMVDNREPPPPVDLRTDFDGAWSASPEVGVRWDSTGDPGSGISSVRWRLVRTDSGYAPATGTIPGSARSTRIRVPEPGDYLFETRFTDQAGNVGPPAVARVRFDDIPPPTARPAVPAGWLSRDELPLPARVEPVVPSGPSGVLGYAVAVSDQGPLSPCRSSICERAEVTLVDRAGGAPPMLGGLREGANWVSSVAVSGALLPSRNPVTARLLVDRTFPETSLAGIPSGWSREPVTLVARSTDALSGMGGEDDDDGEPITVIEAEGGDRVEAEGDRAEVTVAREGITEVRFFARDLAGNISDGRLGPGGERNAPAGEAQVMIDRSAPEAIFSGPNEPGNPSLFSFDLLDRFSGVASGRVTITPVSKPGEPIELPAKVIGSSLETEVPSDDLPPGEYDVLARVVDRAGNQGTSEAVRVVLPLKVPVTLSVSDLKPGDRALSGSVRIGGNRPDRELDLVVEEVFAPSSGIEPRRHGVRSGPDGAFRFPLSVGPRRSVRVLFQGSPTEARAASEPVQVTDRDRVRFETSSRALRNGAVLKMSGQVTGPGMGAAFSGKRVVVQYFDPSRRRWRPVEVLACDEAGRFRMEYRFTTITSPQRILFRALSLGEAAWPFRPSASKEVGVVVRP